MMIENKNTTQDWGSQKLVWRQKLISFFVKMGLSHGSVKKLMQRAWYSNGDKYPVDIIYQGAKFRLHPWDNVIDRKIVFGSAVRDAMEINFLKKHLTKDSVFIDIGANIGYYSCVLAAMNVRRIIAVEPHPFTLQRLSFNVEINNFDSIIQIAPYALGDVNREAILHEVGGDLGRSSVRSLGDETQKQFAVEMISLHALCQKYSITAIDAIKIDVEGVEDAVLVPFFQKAPPSLWPKSIIIEHADHEIWKQDLFACLRENGYIVRKKNRSNAFLVAAE
jgi:FkbM family methyltransferase